MIDRAAVARRAVYVQAPPARKKPPITKLVVAAGDRPHGVWFLNDQVVGVMVHFDAEFKRSYPCIGDDCWFDHAVALPRWQGWIPVISEQDRNVHMMQITPGLATWRPELIDPAVKLRGKFFLVHRRGKSQHGCLFGEFQSARDRQLATPPLDTVKQLERLWNGDGKKGANEPF